MAWPPPVFDFTYTNATSQLDDHPNIHNEVNDSLNTDFRPKIDDNAARLTTNDGLIAKSSVANRAVISQPEWLNDPPLTVTGGRIHLDAPTTTVHFSVGTRWW